MGITSSLHAVYGNSTTIIFIATAVNLASYIRFVLYSSHLVHLPHPSSPPAPAPSLILSSSPATYLPSLPSTSTLCHTDICVVCLTPEECSNSTVRGEVKEMGGGDGIEHRTVEVNGINMHVAEKGEGPAVLFLHGFPELWYSWRHQILSLAARGYRAVAPDLRGYGDTEAPAGVDAYSIFHLVGDLTALIESLGQDKVFVVGHDWGAILAWNLCAFRPEKIKAVVNLSVAFMPRKHSIWRPDSLKAIYGDDFYVSRFQKPGEIEDQFAQVDTAFLMKMFFASRNPGPLIIPKGDGLVSRRLHHKDIPLPSWLSQDDIDYYASKFIRTGFTGGVNYYRNMDINWELTAPWNDVQIKVPAKFIVGDLDLAYHFAGMKSYIHGGGFKRDVPLLEDVVVIEGAAHFINQERPEQISDHIYQFIAKF
ncbi:hypothetical protein KSP39_PZI024066 [Platanthera zijinensis]|uniref:soluble epoxide hydrolase n=1 Tax=Platanthera zijinensis TaxID=2320716 RepID=A0AAP0AU38_9ASPA